MRIKCGPVCDVSNSIRADMMEKLQSAMDIRGIANLSDCAACALVSRSANSGEWKAVLPRDITEKSKGKWILETLDSPLIDVFTVMRAYSLEVVSKLSQDEKTVVLMMDQSQIREGCQILMVSVRFQGRGLPLFWKIKETKGAIGLETQREVLEGVKKMLPPETKVLLSADRFYGTKNLVELCQENNWSYRIRLKGNLAFQHEGRKITATDAGKTPESCVIGASFNNSNISTNIGYLHEKNHPEPWIIAMDCEPSKSKILEYGMRWGIECMFSDFKSRGFSITDTQIQRINRMENLVLALTIALYWAVSVGMTPPERESKNTQKKTIDRYARCLKKECEK